MFDNDYDDYLGDFFADPIEIVAAREEAEREMRAEADYQDYLARVEEAEDRARFPGGRCAADGWGLVQCSADPCPF